MRLSTAIFLPLAFLFATSTAAPTGSHLQRRGLPGAVYICTDPNFRGNCAWQGPSDSCRIIGTGALAPESIGPDPGGFCNLYSNATCGGTPVRSLRFPGAASNLPQFQSIKCFIDGAFQLVPAGQVNMNPNSSVSEDARPKKEQPKVKGTVVNPADLAGGVGSMERKEVEAQLKKMEKDGFRKGFIGQKKNLYY